MNVNRTTPARRYFVHKDPSGNILRELTSYHCVICSHATFLPATSTMSPGTKSLAFIL